MNGACRDQSVTVLGHNPAWISVSDLLRAHRLTIDPRVWARLGTRDQWIATRSFLDQVVTRGDRIVLATSPQRVRVGSYYFRELAHLARRGRLGTPSSATIHVLR